MENFKQIAEDCLAGKISGTFVLRNGKEVNSKDLVRNNSVYHPYTFFDKPFTYTNSGSIYNGVASSHECDIVNFIPDDMQKQIKIDIPEGMESVQETVNGEIRIKFIKKELTYEDICNTLDPTLQIHNFSCPVTNNENFNFVKKVEVLRKLTNIRNYFGKPKHYCDGIVIKCVNSYCGVETGQFYFDKPDLDSPHQAIFDKKEHAQAAIKMLGDELKYLFEPW